MAAINRGFFFHQTQFALFSGNISASQRDGLTRLLDYWEATYVADDDRWLAYVLGTVHHETNRTFKPIREIGSDEYKRHKYDITGDNPKAAKKNGNTAPGDGVRYAGRGYVQLTWKNNYARASAEVGHDFVADPDDALQPQFAVVILFRGMIEGWFTNASLPQYFNNIDDDWLGARRVVNGQDKADLIKGYGLQYYAAISYTTG